jgi:hypothetical protein
MKKIFFVLSLMLVFGAAAQAQDDVAVYGLASNQVLDNNTGLLEEFAAMQSTFLVALTSNVYIEGALFEGLDTFVGGFFDYQISYAEVGFTFSDAVFSTDYAFGANYYLELIDIRPCGYFDWYGFSLLNGDYTSPHTWGGGISLCPSIQLIKIGAIGVLNGLTADSQKAGQPERLRGCKVGSVTGCTAYSEEEPGGPSVMYHFYDCGLRSNRVASVFKISDACTRWEFECIPNGYKLTVKPVDGSGCAANRQTTTTTSTCQSTCQ